MLIHCIKCGEYIGIGPVELSQIRCARCEKAHQDEQKRKA